MIRLSIGFRAFLLVLAAFSLTSCLRTSTIVEVGSDGSGEIVARYYFSPQVAAMVAQMEAIGEAGAPEGMGLPDFQLLKDLLDPKEADLKADAANFGEGVVYESHETGTDEDGWKGYVVTYRFDDIQKVKIDQKSVPTKAQEFVKSSGQDVGDRQGGNLTFTMEGKTLTIHSTLAEGNMENLVDRDKLEKAKEMGVDPAQAIESAAAMMEGMRAGFFVRAKDGISSTTAQHTTGSLVILSDAEVSKVMRDPDFVEFLQKYSDNPDVLTTDAIRELFGKIEAMTVEMGKEIEIEFP